MARNKYPEQTVDKIVESAARLFMEKGYDNTTIQDIINDIGDLTKGAIYHHFKSKEEILMEVTDRLFASQEEGLIAVRDNKNMSGAEKIRKLITASVLDPGQLELFLAAPNLRENPRMLVEMLNSSVGETVTDFILPILEEGIKDGTIGCEYPEEMAEVIMILANIWINPLVFLTDSEKLIRKIKLMTLIAERMGIPNLVDDLVIERLQNYLKVTMDKKEL